MLKTLDLIELIKQCPGTSINVTAGELGTFARQLIAETKREFERERASIEAGKSEKFLEPETVKSMLKISDSTLYRMGRARILEPVWIAGQKRFKQSDIDKITKKTDA